MKLIIMIVIFTVMVIVTVKCSEENMEDVEVFTIGWITGIILSLISVLIFPSVWN